MEVEEPDTGDGEPFIDFSRGEVTDMANVVCADYDCGWDEQGTMGWQDREWKECKFRATFAREMKAVGKYIVLRRAFLLRCTIGLFAAPSR